MAKVSFFGCFSSNNYFKGILSIWSESLMTKIKSYFFSALSSSFYRKTSFSSRVILPTGESIHFMASFLENTFYLFSVKGMHPIVLPFNNYIWNLNSTVFQLLLSPEIDVFYWQRSMRNAGFSKVDLFG